MAVTVHLPQQLRKLASGAARVAAEGATVAALLDDLDRRYPGLRQCIADERGRIRRHVNVFINGETPAREGIEGAALKPGDTVDILPAVSGG